MISPFLSVGVGVVLVLALMLAGRVHAFLALLLAALAVSALTVGATASVAPVLASFGDTAGKIGIVIALAAIIGKCLLSSGAAGVIVEAVVGALGERRAPQGLMAGGFVLAIPVFFDTVFYLLVPLAQSLHRRTGAGYALCLMALAGGAAAAHALVPPTPGPLLVADAFGVPIAQALGFGLLVTLPACVGTYALARRLDVLTPVVLREPVGAGESVSGQVRRVPLWAALAPIVVPVLLIGLAEVARAALGEGLPVAVAYAGMPSVALLVAALISMAVLWYATRLSPKQLSAAVEDSLLSAGVIILITAAGGAFGASLKATGIAEAIATSVDLSRLGGTSVLFAAFAVASLLKVAQGSSTVAMIVGSGMVAAVIDPAVLPFAPVYLALAVGSGSLVGSWMNDSGFWIFAKMGGLTERQTLRTWTPLFSALGALAFAMTVLLSLVAP